MSAGFAEIQRRTAWAEKYVAFLAELNGLDDYARDAQGYPASGVIVVAIAGIAQFDGSLHGVRSAGVEGCFAVLFGQAF